MAIVKTESLPLRSEQDVVFARQAVRRLSQELGFSLVDQTKMVTATSELARNAVIYGLGGTLCCEVVHEGVRVGLRLRFVDNGPGIANLDLALTDGWTSGSGLGLGLTGAKRLMNEFAIDTAPGQGTTVTVARWK
ncbi:MAG: anti-sigma regulatory factor [Vicinamibacterales bacterium]